jgi:hypothetical protein
MKTLTGHLTAANKKAIKAILSANLMSGKINNREYFLSLENGVYTVVIRTKDRGMMPVAGSELRMSNYKHTFTF